MDPPWRCHGSAIEILWRLGFTMEVPWARYGDTTGSHGDTTVWWFGPTKEASWSPHGVSIACPCCLQGGFKESWCLDGAFMV